MEVAAYTAAYTGPLRTPTLRKSPTGTYIARGRVPADVREEYGPRYGKSLEVKFSAPATTKPADAKRLYGEWLAEHEAHVTAIASPSRARFRR